MLKIAVSYVKYLYLRFTEKGELEVLLFTLQSALRANNQKPYHPREGKLIGDINRLVKREGRDEREKGEYFSAWESLEKAEHERELALKEELIRQEKLEQLANRFNRKVREEEEGLRWKESHYRLRCVRNG